MAPSLQAWCAWAAPLPLPEPIPTTPPPAECPDGWVDIGTDSCYILVDDTDPSEDITALFLLEHSVQDGRPTATGKSHIISERLQFAAIDSKGEASNAGIAPHLNLRPAG